METIKNVLIMTFDSVGEMLQAGFFFLFMILVMSYCLFMLYYAYSR
jgi:hypothetical protein